MLTDIEWRELSCSLSQRHLFLSLQFFSRFLKNSLSSFLLLIAAVNAVAIEMPLYREPWFLSGTKFSEKVEEMWKKIVVLKDQFHYKQLKDWYDASCDGERAPNKYQNDCGKIFYKDVLQWLRKRVLWARRAIADNCLLHHDNSPARTTLPVEEFLAKKNIPVFPHMPCSPYLCFVYFPIKLKLKLDRKLTKNCNRWVKCA